MKLYQNSILIAFIAVFLLGAGLRVVNVWQPVDRDSWRELDMSAMARNFYREGMNPLAPRIDWRGDGAGYTEAEFPFISWLMAFFYQLFGVHEVFGRIIAFIFSIGALATFFKLARYLLPEKNALFASFFFALSPLALQLGIAIQPDGLMFFLYLLAAYSFIRWLDGEKAYYFIISLAATALAILAKAPAAHIGLFFAFLVFAKFGGKTFRQPKLWIFAVLALLPALLWYFYARHLWLTYGNSLGLSNEHHWVGVYLLKNPDILTGIFRIEAETVWLYGGLILAAFGVWLQSKEKAVRISLFWLAAIFIYYILAAHTTSRDWARYYHIVSIVPAALLVGAGFDIFQRFPVSRRSLYLFGAAFGSFLLAVVVSLITANSILFRQSLKLDAFFGIAFLCAGIFYIWNGKFSENSIKNSHLISDLMATVGILSVAVTLTFAALTIQSTLKWERSANFNAAQHFAPLLKKDGLIIASGGNCLGVGGQPVAYNASYFFYWLDRKGFNVCTEEQDLTVIENFRQRGAEYFIAERAALAAKPEFETILRQQFTVLAESETAILFELNKTPLRTEGDNATETPK